MQDANETKPKPQSANRLPLLVTFAIAAFAVSAFYFFQPGAPSGLNSPGSATEFAAQTKSAASRQADTATDAIGLASTPSATLDRLELLRAEDAFAQGDTPTALAHLARTIRRHPHNSGAVRRLLFALTHRSFALPASPPLKHTKAVHSARYSSSGHRVVTASEDGTVRLWDAANGAPAGSPIDLGSPVLWAEFDPQGARIVAGTRNGVGWLLDVAGANPPRRLLIHKKPVFHVEFDSTGTLALTASRDSAITVWSAETGDPMVRLAMHEAGLRFARFSPDGKRILSGDANGLAYLWNTGTGEVDVGPMSFPGSVVDGRFSPDGASLALALSDGTARLLETLTGSLICAPIQHANPVRAIAFSPDSLTLATATQGDAQIQLFDAEDGSLLSGPVTAFASAKFLEFTPDGLRLASASTAGAIEIWDGLGLLPLTEPIMESGPVSGLQFSPDGARLLECAPDASAQIRDVRLSGALPREFAHNDLIDAAAFNSTGDRLATASVDGEIRLWEFETSREVWRAKPHDQPVVSIEFSPGGDLLHTTSADGASIRIDAGSGKLIKPSQSHGIETERAELSPDQDWIVTQTPDGLVRLWNAKPGSMNPAFPEIQKEPISHARFSPDGKAIVTANEARVQFWKLPGGTRTGTPIDFPDFIQAIEYVGGGARILVGLDDGSLRLHDTATGNRIGPIMRHNEPIWRIRASPDGRTVATASEDNTARIWSAATATPIVASLQHDTLPWSLAFNADGSLLFTGTLGGRIRGWDLGTGLPLTPSLPQEAPVSIVRFHPHKNIVVTGGGNPILRAWPLPDIDDAPPPWLADLAEALGGRRLNDRGLMEPVSRESLKKIRELITAEDSNEDNPFVVFGAWLFDDPLTHAARPAATQTIRDDIEESLARDNLPRLRHSALRAPADPRIWNRLAELVALSAGSGAPAVNAHMATFFRKRARQLGGEQTTTTTAEANAPPDPKPETGASEPADRSPTDAALYFDGRNSRITAVNVPFDEYDAFTIEAWVQQWRNHILSEGVYDAEENGLWLTLGEAGSTNPRWTCGWKSGAGKNWEHAIAADDPGKWQHLALTFDGRRLSIFLNGQLRHTTEAPAPGPLMKQRMLMIGAQEWTDRLTFGTGFLRNLRVSLTLRYLGDFIPDPTLKADRRTVLLYDFSIDPGLRAIDRSGNERHGTIRGAVWSPGR